MEFDLLKILTILVATPTAGGGVWAVTGAVRANRQAKRDILHEMESGLMTARDILKAATQVEVSLAKKEAFPGPGKKVTYKTHLKISKRNADNLTSVESRLNGILNLPGVYLKPSLRKQVAQVRESLTHGQNQFANSQNEYALGRVLRLIYRMEKIEKSLS